MKPWPPQPGCTLITRSRSISSRYGSTDSTGVSGLSTRPDAHVALAQRVEEGPRVAELHVHDAAVGARIGEVLEEHRRVVDHEMAVEEQLGALAERAHDDRPDGEVGHEMAVHHVDVQEVGRLGHPLDLGREVRKVGGQDRRRKFHGLQRTPGDSLGRGFRPARKSAQ